MGHLSFYRAGLWIGVALLIAGVLAGRTAVSAAGEDYTLGPKDQLAINIWNEEKMSAVVTVSANGTITYFNLGEVKVEGLTINEVRTLLTKRLLTYFRDPIVEVKIQEYHAKEVQILGPVHAPGNYVLDTNTTTLLKLISKAGGTSDNRGNKATVYRGGVNRLQTLPPTKPSSPDPTEGDTAPRKKPGLEDQLKTIEGIDTVEVDLRALLDYGDPSKDVIIYPGDIAIIGTRNIDQPADNFVYVDGQVKTPQKIEWRPGLTVSQAVTEAGGVTDLGSPNRTSITRVTKTGETQKIKVRLKDIQKGKKPDIILERGDRITVQESAF
jgi:protein involved in polysaccharide export with SLBB domain